MSDTNAQPGSAGEPGIQGVTLTLTGIDGNGTSVTDHATTDGTGHYLFSELSGTYTVTVDATNFTAVRIRRDILFRTKVSDGLAVAEAEVAAAIDEAAGSIQRFAPASVLKPLREQRRTPS